MRRVVCSAVLVLVGAGAGYAASEHRPRYVTVVHLQSALPKEQVLEVMDARADAFRALPGLNQKLYLYDPETKRYAGIYLWRSKDAAEAYLRSELRKSLRDAYRIEGAPEVRHYELLRVLRD